MDLSYVSGLWTILSHNDPCHPDSCYLQAGEETESGQLNHLAWTHSFCLEAPLPQPVLLACLAFYASSLA